VKRPLIVSRDFTGVKHSRATQADTRDGGSHPPNGVVDLYLFSGILSRPLPVMAIPDLRPAAERWRGFFFLGYLPKSIHAIGAMKTSIANRISVVAVSRLPCSLPRAYFAPVGNSHLRHPLSHLLPNFAFQGTIQIITRSTDAVS
jgi:hypothetical protein